MNIPLILKAKQAILDHPDGYFQDDWDCGTTACIAGWAARIIGRPIVKLSAPYCENHKEFEESVFEVQRSLKLDTAKFNRLTQRAEWPSPFKNDYRIAVLACDRERAAKIAGLRIDKFIETDGAE